jgi:CBS domain
METIAPIGSYLTPSFEHARVSDAMRPRVLDAEGAVSCRPWGILTDRDVLRCAAVIDDRLDDVAQRLLDQNTSHAVVVEPRTDGLVGVLSTLDIAGILGWSRG